MILKYELFLGSKGNPLANCKELITMDKPSGYYWLKFQNENIEVYCDMVTDGGKYLKADVLSL